MCHLSLIKDSSRTRQPRQQNVLYHTLNVQYNIVRIGFVSVQPEGSQESCVTGGCDWSVATRPSATVFLDHVGGLPISRIVR